MNTLLTLTAGKWGLVIAPAALRPTILAFTARLAEHGTVRVLDGGNQFNVYIVARAARGRKDLLEQIQISRAFTCYQMLALLEGTAALPFPFVVLDLLATFQDENVPMIERERLLAECITHLHRLSHGTFGLVSVSPLGASKVENAPLIETLLDAANEVWQPDAPKLPLEPLRLF